MKLIAQILMVFLFVLELGSCRSHIDTAVRAENSVTGGSNDPDPNYELIQKISWDKSEKCSIEASLLSSRLPLISLPPNTPKSIFEIRETHSGKILLRQEDVVAGLSLELVRLHTLEEENLLLVTYAGGSAESAQAHLVNCDATRRVFDEGFRDYFWHLEYYDKERSHFVMFTADNLTEYDNRLMLQKWEWNGKSFSKAGLTEFEGFLTKINALPPPSKKH